MKKFFTWVAAVAGGIPLTVYAQSNPLVTASGTFGDIITAITKNILGALTTLFASAALAAFFFGIVKFILGLRNGAEKDVTNGKQFMLWGLFALFIMFSVWGIIRYGQTILGLPQGSNIIIPTIKFGDDTSANNSNSNSNNGVQSVYTDPLNSQGQYTCPDGITKYYNASDRNTVCNTTTNTNSTGGYTTPTSPSCGRYDSFGTCCDQQNQYIDNYGGCQSAFD